MQMRLGKVAVVFALLLLANRWVCVASCVNAVSAPVPHCHQHQGPASCAHAIVVSEAALSTAATGPAAAAGFVPVRAAAFGAPAAVFPALAEWPGAPPDTSPGTLFVLRI